MRANAATSFATSVGAIAILGLFAFGCAREGEQHATYASSSPQPTPASTTAAPTRTKNETATGLRMGHLDDEHNHGPVSLTGENGYLERFDPSGWSGSSTPKAIGGGPPAEGLTDMPENPYEDGNAAPTDTQPKPPESTGEMGY